MNNKKLKKVLHTEEITYDFLEKEIGRHRPYIADRMMGRKPWTLDEVYQICDSARIPYEKISEYFPRSKKLKDRRKEKQNEKV